MARVHFRFRTIMIAILVVAVSLFMARSYVEKYRISGLSIGIDSWNLPVLILSVSTPIAFEDEPAILDQTIACSLVGSVASVAYAIALCLIGYSINRIGSRAIRMRREKLDRQFAMKERVETVDQGHIRGLAEFTRSINVPRVGP
jgi:hypothetical protein